MPPYCPGGVSSLAAQGVGRPGPSLGALGGPAPGRSRFLEAPALPVPAPCSTQRPGQQRPPGASLVSELPLRVASHLLPLPLWPPPLVISPGPLG